MLPPLQPVQTSTDNDTLGRSRQLNKFGEDSAVLTLFKVYYLEMLESNSDAIENGFEWLSTKKI